MPQALRDRPVADRAQSYFISVFYDLTGSRSYSAGGSPLPIPISEFKSYCELFYINGVDERERLLRMVKAADAKFIDVANERAEQERAKQKSR